MRGHARHTQEAELAKEQHHEDDEAGAMAQEHFQHEEGEQAQALVLEVEQHVAARQGAMQAQSRLRKNAARGAEDAP